ncbi:MAG: hypothetical protein SGARI_004458 [Bacillariaceae sp.]
MNIESSSMSRLPADDSRRAMSDSCSTTDNSDRLQFQIDQKGPVMSPPPQPLLGKFLPPLLSQANGGLSQFPQSTLRDSLQLVIAALEQLDAEALLDLKVIVPKQNPSQTASLGPRDSCVRYLHVSEVPDQYSIGIFVFGPNARIPLHDHPDMVVLSRVLYGDLHRLSLDLAREEESSLFDEYETGLSSRPSPTASWFRGSWFGRMNSIRKDLPKGSKAAFKNEVDYLQAPDVTVLYPYEGNLHEFVAGPQGAAVLDVLLPPYDNAQNRDCTFYNIQNVDGTNGNCNNEDAVSSSSKQKQPCFIVPTGQPENFHCISGQYRDLGEQPDSYRDADDAMADS